MQKTQWMTLVFAAVLAAGCQSEQCGKEKNGSASKELYEDPFFRTANSRSPTREWFVAARDVGRAKEATLYRQHFNGGEINSLGVERLASMVAGKQSEEKMTVYLDLGDAADKTLAAPREKSVAEFLEHKGLYKDQIQVVAGANPTLFNPSDRAIKAYNGAKADGGADAGR